jgi:uncharacterized membrane protein YhhN
MTTILIAAIFVSGIATILSDAEVRRPAFYLLKPLTTIFVILLAATWPEAVRPDGYRWIIVLALGFCLMGDIALMWKSHFALGAGIGAFMCAHGLFIMGFLGLLGINMVTWTVVISGMAGLSLFLASQGFLKPIAAIYGAILTAMLLCAYVAFEQLGDGPAALAALGAGMFLISDALIAYRMFRRPFPAAQLSILSTYWLGITLIALSV